MKLTVNLKDISDAGREFSYKKGLEKALDILLEEQLGLAEFQVDFQIIPMGEIFTAQGSVESQKNEQCSLCGDEAQAKIKRNFSEYLVKQEPRDAEGRAPHTGLDVENSKEVTFFESYDFDLADFIREQFAVALPDYPKCEDVKSCEQRQQENSQFVDTDSIKPDGHPAFQVLDQLKKH